MCIVEEEEGEGVPSLESTGLREGNLDAAIEDEFPTEETATAGGGGRFLAGKEGFGAEVGAAVDTERNLGC